MLKLVLKDTDDKPPRTIILGLSHKNLDMLKKNYPIRFDSSEIGLPPGTEILIFAGDTEQSMAQSVEKFVGPKTKVYVSPKLKN